MNSNNNNDKHIGEFLHVPRSEGGRGLISAEEYIEQARISLQNYTLDSDEKLIQAARKESSSHTPLRHQKTLMNEGELKVKQSGTCMASLLDRRRLREFKG